MNNAVTGIATRCRTEWVQIPLADLTRYDLSGSFFISRNALSELSGNGPTLYDVLDALRTLAPAVAVGDTVALTGTLEARFGFDDVLPNGDCFVVQIDLSAKLS